MKLLNVPFIIITFSIIIGILIGYYVFIDITTALVSLLISISFLWVLWRQSRKMFAQLYPFTIGAILVFIVFGIVLVKIHHPKSYSTHYTNQIATKDLYKDELGILFSVRERLKSSSYYDKYIIIPKIIKGKPTQGKLLLRIPKNSTQNILNIGDTYTTFATIQCITKPKNPNQFDYAEYMSGLYIFDQITTTPNLLIKNHNHEWSVLSIADQIRKYINKKLVRYNFSRKQLSIINALILGQRQDISQETLNAYRDAGAIHILAVSGLHVGILLLIINFILKPLDRLKKRGKGLKLLLAIILLWCFAVIAGLSPSVLRSVTMFSFLAIGLQLKSKTSIYNSLITSIFILLCFNPLLVFSVGFQLSYVAVFAIVWIQPMLSKIYNPKFYSIKKMWETLTVTIAAQLGILPLALFYFHQFPLLFFVSNLIIIPFLGGILGFGILIILLAIIGFLPEFMVSLFGSCINVMNTIISWIATQEEFLITDIPFSWPMIFAVYAVIISLVITLQNYEKRRTYSIGLSFIAMLSILTFEKHIVSNKEELIIFQNQRNTTIGILQNQKLQIYSKDSIPIKAQQFLFGNYLTQHHAILDTIVQLKNSYQYKERILLVIDSSSIYTIKGLQPDIILLSGSPKIHLDRIISNLQPKQIIADGSNYKSYIKQWEVTCQKSKIPFYQINKKGAYIVK